MEMKVYDAHARELELTSAQESMPITFAPSTVRPIWGRVEQRRRRVLINFVLKTKARKLKRLLTQVKPIWLSSSRASSCNMSYSVLTRFLKFEQV